MCCFVPYEGDLVCSEADSEDLDDSLQDEVDGLVSIIYWCLTLHPTVAAAVGVTCNTKQVMNTALVHNRYFVLYVNFTLNFTHKIGTMHLKIYHCARFHRV